MRVLQLVDSLEVGGTERVAVNIANALSKNIEASFLCTTRKEGLLKESLKKEVGYLFLKKKSTFDFKTLITLRAFVKKSKIDFIHAHSSSFFFATLLKISYPNIKIIWHDHYGNSEFLNERKSKVLIIFSRFFTQILSVNEALKNWADEKLHCKQVKILPNFATPVNNTPITKLKGKEGKRIIHLANLRSQKDHETLLKAFKKVVNKHNEWTLHCVGKNFSDSYSDKIQSLVDRLNLKENVFFYGGRPDVSNILSQSNIAVLSSKSEGLPIALLEYGFAKLPTIATNVGDCFKVISNNNEGFLIDNQDTVSLKEAMVKCINSKELRMSLGNNLYNKVNKSYSEKAIIKKLLNIYNHHLK